jgi:uncharacterized protein DUF397
MEKVPFRTVPRWRKSSYSSDTGECVEAALGGAADAVAVRDSKRAGAAHATVSAAAWRAFVDGVVEGSMR